jgi:hypothetical protein
LAWGVVTAAGKGSGFAKMVRRGESITARNDLTA